MSAPRPRARITALALLCWIGGASATAGRVAAATPPPDEAASWTATILARPLFRRDRRPALPPAAAALPAASLPRLTATLLGPFGKRAVFTLDGTTVSAGEGGRIAVWKVTAIEAGLVTLTQAEDARALVLTFAAPKLSAPATAVAASRPFWSNPCGRPHRHDENGRAVRPNPELCQAAAQSVRDLASR